MGRGFTTLRQDSWNVRLGEIATLEEQRLTRHGREGVSEAITEVQTGRVISPTEQAPGLARRLGLLRSYGLQLDPGSLNK